MKINYKPFENQTSSDEDLYLFAFEKLSLNNLLIKEIGSKERKKKGEAAFSWILINFAGWGNGVTS
jgi:hypothetical protein